MSDIFFKMWNNAKKMSINYILVGDSTLEPRSRPWILTPQCHFTIPHNNEWDYTYKPSVLTKLNPRCVSVPLIVCRFFRVNHNAYYTMHVIIITKHSLCHMTDKTREARIYGQDINTCPVVPLFLTNYLKLNAGIT